MFWVFTNQNIFIILKIFIISRKFSQSRIFDLWISETKFMYLSLHTISQKRLKCIDPLFKTEGKI